MKKLFLFLLLAPLMSIAQTGVAKNPAKAPIKTPVKVTPKGFLIEAKFDGYADGTPIHLYKNGENVEIATTKIMKGKFSLKGTVDEPVLCFLAVGDDNKMRPAEIYVENTVISVKANKAKPDIYDITGSASHKDFASFVAKFLPVAQQLSSLASTINQTEPGELRESLMKTYTSKQELIQAQIDNFITEKPKSPVSTFVLNATYQFNEDPIILEQRFNKLDATVKNSASGKELQAVIAESKVGAVGTEAMDFTQADTTGTPVSLSSFRGKYVLVDFWASWCGPCRNENPNVVENYNKFNKKNFTVLGVSLDRPGQKEKWLEAIHADNLTWTHVSDLQFWNNAAAQLYNVKGIPQNFLVDPAGKIVAKNLRGPALEAKLCELLGCN